MKKNQYCNLIEVTDKKWWCQMILILILYERGKKKMRQKKNNWNSLLTPLLIQICQRICSNNSTFSSELCNMSMDWKYLYYLYSIALHPSIPESQRAVGWMHHSEVFQCICSANWFFVSPPLTGSVCVCTCMCVYVCTEGVHVEELTNILGSIDKRESLQGSRWKEAEILYDLFSSFTSSSLAQDLWPFAQTVKCQGMLVMSRQLIGQGWGVIMETASHPQVWRDFSQWVTAGIVVLHYSFYTKINLKKTNSLTALLGV